jgi:hypothetical protein
VKSSLFWRIDKKNKRWTVRRFDTGPVLGAVTHNFDGWCGIICFPGKKWPDGQRSVHSVDRKFWSVRRSVEWTIAEAHVEAVRGTVL